MDKEHDTLARDVQRRIAHLPSGLPQQRGLSLTGLLLLLAVVGLTVILIAKSIPAWNEYFAVKRALAHIATSSESVSEARKSFDRFAEIDRITSIKGSDIVFEPNKGGVGGLVGHFEYEARIPIGGNVSILFEFKN